MAPAAHLRAAARGARLWRRHAPGARLPAGRRRLGPRGVGLGPRALPVQPTPRPPVPRQRLGRGRRWLRGGAAQLGAAGGGGVRLRRPGPPAQDGRPVRRQRQH